MTRMMNAMRMAANASRLNATSMTATTTRLFQPSSMTARCISSPHMHLMTQSMSSTTTTTKSTTAAKRNVAATTNKRQSSSAPSIDRDPNFHEVYVHHVSKQVLQYLQDSQYQWMEHTGLNRGLRINPNGTFTMHFPKRTAPANATPVLGLQDAGRIWTSYDTSTKQHWLSVYRSKLKARFLLKDHGKTVGNTRIHNAMEEQKRVCDAVDHMIQSLQQAEVGQ